MSDSRRTNIRSVTAVVAEDEAHLRDELCEALLAAWPGLEIRARAADGGQALDLWKRHSPDVLFLDIRMPGLSGLEVARRAGGRSHVVFVTAYDEYAIQAFESGAVDYLLKPFEPARLATTIERLKSRLDSAPAALDDLLRALSARLPGPAGHLRWITASQGQELRLFTVEEICYFRADQKYTVVASADREALISKPIKELVELLDPATFWQIHRATIVNLRHVAGVTRDYRGQLFVKLRQRRETLAVSASYANRFRSM